jgi:hypothetical protein
MSDRSLPRTARVVFEAPSRDEMRFPSLRLVEIADPRYERPSYVLERADGKDAIGATRWREVDRPEDARRAAVALYVALAESQAACDRWVAVATQAAVFSRAVAHLVPGNADLDAAAKPLRQAIAAAQPGAIVADGPVDTPAPDRSSTVLSSLGRLSTWLGEDPTRRRATISVSADGAELEVTTEIAPATAQDRPQWVSAASVHLGEAIARALDLTTDGGHP